MTANPRIVPIELLDIVLTSQHGLQLHRGTDTHESALRFVGQLVTQVQDIELIEQIVVASLPRDYSGNTLGEVAKMAADAIAKGFDQPKTTEKAKRDTKQSDVALELMKRSGIELFHTPLGDAFASLPRQGGGAACYPVKSSAFAQQIRLTHFDATGKSLSQSGLDEVVDLMEARALYRSPQEEVHIRLAGHNGKIYIDLGSADSTVVCISTDGWSLTTDCPVRLWRPPDFGQLPLPVANGNVSELRDILGLDVESFTLFLAFLIVCLSPDGPYMILLVQGEQGSGKSLLCSLAKRLLDPAAIERLRMPSSEHDLAIQASQNRVLVFDNASSVKFDISDALCSLATGAGFTTRKFYTDNESRAFKHVRPIVINGIGDFANRPDLLERAIQLKLKAMPARARRTEKQIGAEFEKALPRLLGALFTIATFALKTLPTTEPPTSVRMADAAHWLVAAEGATGLPRGTLLAALEHGQRDMMLDRAANDPLVIAVFKLLDRKEDQSFRGMVGELHEAILAQADRYNPRMPATPAHLSNALQRLAPVMARVGLHLEFEEKTRRGRPIHIWLEGDDTTASIIQRGGNARF